MLRRSLVRHNSPELIGKPFKGKHTPFGFWLNTDNNDRVADMGPGDLKVGIFDPFWNSPFIGIYDGSAKALKHGARDLGQHMSEYASCSLRIGGATSLIHSGATPEAVRRFGRWKSDTW